MRRALVFGKFMPLHRGHQLLIEAAMAECDEVTVVVYDSPATGRERMPVAKRLGWVADLYPRLEQIVAVPDPWYLEEGHDGPEYAERYAGELKFLGDFDKVFTSERGYRDFVETLGAEHVVLDEARLMVPISGTEIRADLYAHRGWMDPLVYSSLIRKVVMVGTESTGKTTLARELARLYDTRWVHEYGRELWTVQGGGSFADHVPMARRQLEREAAASRHARDFLFCDTNAWTTLHWSLFEYGCADERLWRMAADTMGDYTWVMCGMDIPFEEDGIRQLQGSRAAEMQTQQTLDLNRRLGAGYIVATGPLHERVEAVSRAISGGVPKLIPVGSGPVD